MTSRLAGGRRRDVVAVAKRFDRERAGGGASTATDATRETAVRASRVRPQPLSAPSSDPTTADDALSLDEPDAVTGARRYDAPPRPPPTRRAQGIAARPRDATETVIARGDGFNAVRQSECIGIIIHSRAGGQTDDARGQQ